MHAFRKKFFLRFGLLFNIEVLIGVYEQIMVLFFVSGYKLSNH